MVNSVPAGVTTRCDLRPQNQSRPVLVEVADVAHAVPEAARRVGDLRQRRRLGPVVVRARHHRPAHDDLADLARRQLAGRRPTPGSARR